MRPRIRGVALDAKIPENHMKILLASDTYYPHVNGASYFTQRLAHALADRGHEVAVIAPSQTMAHTDDMHARVRVFGIRSFPVFFYPGFRPARTRYSLPDKPILLFVGRLDKEKNIDVALRAVALAVAHTDFHFVVAGSGAEKPALEALAQRLGIGAHVTFTGFVPDDLLPSLYAAAACFVNAGTAELQSIVTMEAMATGLPVLGARAVALPELIRDHENGFLFDPGNAKELARHLVNIFAHAELRAAMGRNSLAIIAPHDINATLDSFEDFYRAALREESSLARTTAQAWHPTP